MKPGYTVNQTWKACQTAWLGYTIEKKKGEDDRKKYYASVIQQFRKELGFQPLDIDEAIKKMKIQ
ncbi:MAG: hypothetical protein WCF23_00190 [Candidatus Nitrosopolaris sp.]